MTKKQRDHISRLAQRHLALQLEDNPKTRADIRFYACRRIVTVAHTGERGWVCWTMAGEQIPI